MLYINDVKEAYCHQEDTALHISGPRNSRASTQDLALTILLSNINTHIQRHVLKNTGIHN